MIFIKITQFFWNMLRTIVRNVTVGIYNDFSWLHIFYKDKYVLMCIPKLYQIVNFENSKLIELFLNTILYILTRKEKY